MLRGICAPTDFISKDENPSFTPEEKLAIIEASPVHVWQSVINGVPYNDNFIVSLPFVDGASFSFNLKGMEEVLYTGHVNVGDRDLYGKGIGSRLLKAAIKHATCQDNRINELRTGWARLGLVNAAISVLGEENVGVTNGGQRYGWGGDQSIDAVFDDYPPTPNDRYLVYEIVARIDSKEVEEWDKPVRVLPAIPKQRAD